MKAQNCVTVSNQYELNMGQYMKYSFIKSMAQATQWIVIIIIIIIVLLGPEHIQPRAGNV